MPLSEIEAEMNQPLTSSPVTPYHQTEGSNHATSSTVIHSNSNEQFHDNYIVTPNIEENVTTVEEDNDEEPPLSLDELMYSANSFHAIARPVSFTMILAALAAVYINDEETMAAEEAQFAESYQVWDLDSGGGGGSWSKNLLASVGNAFVMVLVIAAMTFGIVLLYKYRCMKILIGYMVFSSASLLGVLGDYLSTLAIEIYRIPIDVISYNISIYNFAVVGVIAIFYQKGIPSYVTQIYLVFTSVILAW
jgi:presenilin 1